MENEYNVATGQEIEGKLAELPALQALKDEIFEHQLAISRLRDLLFDYYFKDRIYTTEDDTYQEIRRRNKKRLDNLGFGQGTRRTVPLHPQK